MPARVARTSRACTSIGAYAPIVPRYSTSSQGSTPSSASIASFTMPAGASMRVRTSAGKDDDLPRQVCGSESCLAVPPAADEARGACNAK